MTEQELPQEVKTYYDKARLAMEKDNYEYAIELLIQGLSLKQDFAEGRHLLRQAEKKLIDKNPPSIIEQATSRLSSFLTVIKATLFEKQGKYSKALDSYEEVLRKNPRNNTILLRLGDLLFREGYSDAALATFEESLRIESNNVPALRVAGKLYAKSGNYQKAKTCYQTLLQFNPKDQGAIKGLKNLDALGTIRDKFSSEGEGEVNLR